MTRVVQFFPILLLACFACSPGKHLFILSGQSNMVALKPEESFLPTLEKEFGARRVVVAKYAMGSQPIRRWYAAPGLPPEKSDVKADLYDSLLSRITKALGNHKISSATLIWMQGERDAREGLAAFYEQSLAGLYNRVAEDIHFRRLNFVIGRLSDFDMKNEKYPDWTAIRDIQMKTGSSRNNFAWVDTDDLNDGVSREGKTISNDLHLSAEGYKTLGKRFAEKSIALIRRMK